MSSASEIPGGGGGKKGLSTAMPGVRRLKVRSAATTSGISGAIEASGGMSARIKAAGPSLPNTTRVSPGDITLRQISIG